MPSLFTIISNCVAYYRSPILTVDQARDLARQANVRSRKEMTREFQKKYPHIMNRIYEASCIGNHYVNINLDVNKSYYEVSKLLKCCGYTIREERYEGASWGSINISW